MTKDQAFEFFRRLCELQPEPETELEFGNLYQLLVAVVLSAQATDAGVNKATRALFREVKTPAQMVALGEEALKAHIKTIGLFNTKARNVIALSQALIALHGGEVPRERETLVTLPATGYIIATAHWGNGYATEATRAMIDLARSRGYPRVEAGCHPKNRASVRVLEKCGLRHETTLKAHMMFPNLSGTLGDLMMFAIEL